MGSEGDTQNKDICSMCAKPSPSTICPTCEARVRGELLDEKSRTEHPSGAGTG